MSKKRILIVDDEVDFTEIISTLLDFHDFQADTINDPKQVITQLQKNNYDLIVSDLMMPGMDGFQLIAQLHQDPKLREIPIIVLSAKTLSDEERKSLLVSNVSFVTKPFEPNALVEKITQMLA